jgi:hypothetical protein
MKSPAEGFKRILEVLDRMEIPYQVVGSIASSWHGIPRSTVDADLVVDLRVEQVDELASELSRDFYADPGMMKEALRRGRSFNLVHFESSYKYDIFPLKRDEYSQTQFGRRRFEEVSSLGEPVECAIASAEDTILSKLQWFRAGGNSSEKQWNDIRGILQIQQDKLDLAYLRHWAPRLGVADLLEEVLNEE